MGMNILPPAGAQQIFEKLVEQKLFFDLEFIQESGHDEVEIAVKARRNKKTSLFTYVVLRVSKDGAELGQVSRSFFVKDTAPSLLIALEGTLPPLARVISDKTLPEALRKIAEEAYKTALTAVHAAKSF